MMKNTNEMELVFDSRPVNEGFARVSVAAFMTQLQSDFGGSVRCKDCGLRGSHECADPWV